MPIETTSTTSNPMWPQWHAVDAALDRLHSVLMSTSDHITEPIARYAQWAAAAVQDIETTAAALDSASLDLIDAEVKALRNPLPYSRRNWYSALDAVSCVSVSPPLRALLSPERRDRLTEKLGAGVWGAVLAATTQGIRRGGDLEWQLDILGRPWRTAGLVLPHTDLRPLPLTITGPTRQEVVPSVMRPAGTDFVT
ncbi:hypothetical protein [Nocardia suismassiliense]|uniref:hypothetical protein n=1 Tax=Nocardia suismassiliense TaxID=2077092 RepID=UPI00131F1CE0|nr:hypothetical protein [Nocardia suismassiliense]